MAITRWNPFDELTSLHTTMDRLFGDMFEGRGENNNDSLDRVFRLPVDISESDNSYVIKAPVPGFKPEEVDVTVDGNVLIYERIREEVHAGRTPFSAISAGFERAFATIVDSNLTTFIAGAMLYAFGSGPVKGFAVTLSIGLATSMFTAVMVTRFFVALWVRRARPQTLPI